MSGTSNKMLMEGFEWHSSHNHYESLTRLLPLLSHFGVTSLWLPPGCKAMNLDGNGYDIYDLWDLGEFDQQGRRRTKWGDIEQLTSLIKKAAEVQIDIIWDAVLNHKAGAEATEEVWAVEVDEQDRRVEICPPKKIEAWLRFSYPGRQQADTSHSKMQWRAEHFNGTDYEHREHKKAIFKLIDPPGPDTLTPPRGLFQKIRQSAKKRPGATIPSRSTKIAPPRRPGKGWSEDADDLDGNDDFLMFSNIDYTHPEVRRDVLNWGTWMIDSIGVDGFRLDGARHISYSFMREWIGSIGKAQREKTGKEAFVVAEFWTGEVQRITKWLDAVKQPSGGPRVYAFDAPLFYNFANLSDAISKASHPKSTPNRSPLVRPAAIETPDLRTLLRNSLLAARPDQTATLITNHDTQPGQALATPIDSRLKLLFYAFILLRKDGLPCLFWGDLFGTQGPLSESPVGVSREAFNVEGTARRSLLAELMMCRKLFAFGPQQDYWTSPSCIGWTRAGDSSHPGCVVVLSIQPRVVNTIQMQIGKPGERWFDVLGYAPEDVLIDRKGSGLFSAHGPGISVFVRRDSPGADKFPVLLDFGLLDG
ncbi:uncharacterized protein LTR77_008157 [Saxophila tyrrhenica]|uniref:Glycosyl hydrolase family 13 catalytic domain-containing protein n=1 Tax=Saxophila tyrrhenica TaxID=1690608 RepID=A0AAV9P607_9PEZI|nr:hypothetical protein LTR77_008157 [Saxophila tyrrhenica]